MVRLKVSKSILINTFNKISIPYGAIKSNDADVLNLFTAWISIPYGAIKRNVPLNLCHQLSEFQFLMVRLKGF